MARCTHGGPGSATREPVGEIATLAPDADRPALVPGLAEHQALALPGARRGRPYPPALGIAAAEGLAQPVVDVLIQRAEPAVLADARGGIVGHLELGPEPSRDQLAGLVAQ